MNDILTNWRSGFVRRYHMNPEMAVFDDLTSAHQGRCGMLVINLWPDHSPSLLRAAVTHDAAEFVVGDLSRPFKRTGAKVVCDHADLEAVELGRMGLAEVLSPGDQARLKLVDMLDSYLFVALRCPRLLAGDGWPEMRLEIGQAADALRVGREVSHMMMEATA